MEYLEKISVLIFNLSIGLSLFRRLGFTVRSKWDLSQSKFKLFDFALFIISGLALFVFYQSYKFTHLLDWLLVLVLLLFGIEKTIWKYTDAKRNSILFLLCLFVDVLFQIEFGAANGKHYSSIDPILIVYSSFLSGMVICLLAYGKRFPSNAGKYLFYVVFFKAYLYFSKLVITWYAGFPSEISWINLHAAPQNYFLLSTVIVGILIPFILYFPHLINSQSWVKVGLYIMLLSSVPELFLMYF